MCKLCSILSGMFLGAAIGAGVVLLLTPRSGAETQQLIRDRVQAIVDEGRQAADARRQELSARFEGLKQPPAA